MGWKAYYRDSDGRLLSVGSVHPEEAPAGVTTVDLPGPPADDRMWDEATRGYVAKPPAAKTYEERFNEKFSDHKDAKPVLDKLPAADKQTLLDALEEILKEESEGALAVL